MKGDIHDIGKNIVKVLLENYSYQVIDRGRRLLKLPYRARQLEYVRLILEHPIFHDLFEAALQIGDVPDKEYVAKKMREYQVCGENLIVRRSSSVRAWLYWILTLVNEG